jgi:hypothetical protein
MTNKTWIASFIGMVILFACLLCIASQPSAVTLYLPNAEQGSMPLCISNRGHSNVNIPSGPVLRPGESVTAAVVADFNWGFTTPTPTNERVDVDCIVIAE